MPSATFGRTVPEEASKIPFSVTRMFPRSGSITLRASPATLAMWLALSASACNSHNLQRYDRVDPNVKTVTVPPGSEGLKGPLKQTLVANGWKLVVYPGPTMSQGTISDTIRVQEFETFKTRYRLLVASERLDLCLNGRTFVRYDISLIDNDTGTEVFTLSGRGCENAVVGKFRDALDQR